MMVTACAAGSIIPVSRRLVFSSSELSSSPSRPVEDNSVERDGASSSISGMKNPSGVGINNSRQLSRVLAAIIISGSSSVQQKKTEEKMFRKNEENFFRKNSHNDPFKFIILYSVAFRAQRLGQWIRKKKRKSFKNIYQKFSTSNTLLNILLVDLNKYI